MDKLIFERTLASLDAYVQEKGTLLAYSSDTVHIPILIEEKNFHSLPFFREQARIIAVDGGNAELISGAGMSLQFMRLAAVSYQQGKKVSSVIKEFFCLVRSDTKNYVLTFFGDAPLSTLQVPVLQETLDGQRKELEAGQAAGYARRLAELIFAKEQLQEGYLVLDGSMRCTTEEEQTFLKELLDASAHSHCSVSFLSKTCRLLTQSGRSLTAALQTLGPKTSWSYYPVFKRTTDTLLFVKLHANSNHVFKLELSSQTDREKMVSILSEYSSDAVFLGYPYCLIEADRSARVSNDEKEYFRLLFSARVKDPEKLSQLLSTLDAHSFLDRIG